MLENLSMPGYPQQGVTKPRLQTISRKGWIEKSREKPTTKQTNKQNGRPKSSTTEQDEKGNSKEHLQNLFRILRDYTPEVAR